MYSVWTNDDGMPEKLCAFVKSQEAARAKLPCPMTLRCIRWIAENADSGLIELKWGNLHKKSLEGENRAQTQSHEYGDDSYLRIRISELRVDVTAL
jgi:hypothetical protein